MHPQYSNNPQLAQAVANNPVFNAVDQQVQHDRDQQVVRWNYTYYIAGTVSAGATQPFNLTIEQGTDFKQNYLTGSAFAYNTETGSSFPMPNASGLTSWAARGLSVMITDTRSGRTLTSGYIPFELIMTPGYGMNFQHPMPFRYFWYRNTKVQFDIRNRDGIDQDFAIALNGFKELVPGQ